MLKRAVAAQAALLDFGHTHLERHGAASAVCLPSRHRMDACYHAFNGKLPECTSCVLWGTILRFSLVCVQNDMCSCAPALMLAICYHSWSLLHAFSVHMSVQVISDGSVTHCQQAPCSLHVCQSPGVFECSHCSCLDSTRKCGLAAAAVASRASGHGS